MRGADMQKVPSLDFCKLLGCNLIICSNPSGVFSTVTHSVVQGVGATAARYRHGGGYSFCCPSCPGCPRTVTRPLKSAPRRRHRPTAQPLRATSCPHDAPTVGRPAASTTESPPSAQPSASSARTGPRARPRAAFSSGECGMATGGRRCAVQTYRKYPPWIPENY